MCGQPYRGFESHPLRFIPNAFRCDLRKQQLRKAFSFVPATGIVAPNSGSTAALPSERGFSTSVAAAFTLPTDYATLVELKSLSVYVSRGNPNQMPFERVAFP